MKETRLIFCDSSTLKDWVDYYVACKLQRVLAEKSKARIETTVQYVRHLQEKGMKISCTAVAACHAITELYKGDPPFSGATEGFPLKKSFAREAADILRRSVHLLAPGLPHFELATQLWFAYCIKGVKEAWAGFGDYLDAALIICPVEGTVVPHVVVAHVHLKYILEKHDCTATVSLV